MNIISLQTNINNRYKSLIFSGVATSLLFLQSCGTSDSIEMTPPPLSLPVVKVLSQTTSTFKEYPSILEGRENVEIRPQADGYLEKTYFDEGDFVKAGQVLFRIEAQRYQEQSRNAEASLQAAKAQLERSRLEVSRLEPLVKNNVVSEVQLNIAQAAYKNAEATLAQAKALAQDADINLSYTLVKAPVSGYAGALPFKTGSLISRGQQQPLTVISDTREIYAYFSMSEIDFLKFKEEVNGTTIGEKINNLPLVELVLADKSVYAEKGKIEIVQGQFDNTTGSIRFRASFPNNKGILRSGSTGNIRIPKLHDHALIIPQEATYEVQDKTFIFTVSKEKRVSSKVIDIKGKAGQSFIVHGVAADELIVYSGHDRLRDSVIINPQLISADSLFKIGTAQ
ncbi:efflux RND transporter periplasmic adaptor subunit [Sporocytophaga myxococcoides]|uniref:efflux RND transporter periplasmic adaptor subunit n=1 Tax=Sporocytophaga myxococcoides TaxID=153721 RepID=UPI00056554A4|nr:efflux RND transporter periplasmic adaptor subunit [Sporocytophaga myxococcoides]